MGNNNDEDSCRDLWRRSGVERRNSDILDHHPFTVSEEIGFLPLKHPLTALPSEFTPLEDLLQRMPIKTVSGDPGLLALGELGVEVRRSLPDLTEHVLRFRNDMQVIVALYRDYSFLASGYLLEPCHRSFVEKKAYGHGVGKLPACIARPFVMCAEMYFSRTPLMSATLSLTLISAGFKPFLEFASYVLQNYRLQDPTLGMDFNNLRLIRAFESGLDPRSAESGFILTHFNMVKLSGNLVRGAMKMFEGVCMNKNSPRSSDARKHFNTGLRCIVNGVQDLNNLMKTIYEKSDPNRYNDFRTFMFGTASESMFPGGVVYEGCYDNKPQFLRGETGANDAMVPMLDNLLQISMPDTPLTEILHEFSEYRSHKHKEFLTFVKDFSLESNLKAFAVGDDFDSCSKAPSSGLRERGSVDSDHSDGLILQSQNLWLQALDQVRCFRWRHWCLVKEYVLKRSDHPTATGGSPIVTWLPNQLEAVIDEMIQVDSIAKRQRPGGMGKVCEEVMETAHRQKATLRKEVDKHCAGREA